jgi:hypothetical protein
MIDQPPWDLRALNTMQREIIQGALDATRFNFAALIPGLEAQVRRNTIPVLFSDLTKYRVTDEGAEIVHGAHGDVGHSHDPVSGLHVIEREFDGRMRVLGLAWYSGKVEVELTLQSTPLLAQEVFLAEGAHMVDFFFMRPEHRERIFAAYHADAAPHDHGWFEETGNTDYWSWVGESFMYGFIAAFSEIQGTGDEFIHRTTPEIGLKIREILQPPMKVARHVKSSIYHRIGGWHERQIADAVQEPFLTPGDAEAVGLRRCKTCRWIEI